MNHINIIPVLNPGTHVSFMRMDEATAPYVSLTDVDELISDYVSPSIAKRVSSRVREISCFHVTDIQVKRPCGLVQEKYVPSPAVLMACHDVADTLFSCSSAKLKLADRLEVIAAWFGDLSWLLGPWLGIKNCPSEKLLNELAETRKRSFWGKPLAQDEENAECDDRQYAFRFTQ